MQLMEKYIYIRLQMNTPEIGIDLMEDKRNKGIATKTIKLVAKRAYEDKKVNIF